LRQNIGNGPAPFSVEIDVKERGINALSFSAAERSLQPPERADDFGSRLFKALLHLHGNQKLVLDDKDTPCLE
jgi:hypothetical protein